MTDHRDNRDFEPVERSFSIPEKPPDKSPKDKVKRESTRSGKDFVEEIMRDPEYSSGALSKSIIIGQISVKLKMDIKEIRDEKLLKALYSITSSDYTITDTPQTTTLSKILEHVEEKLEEKPPIIKFFVSKTIVYCWIGARKGIPKFKAVEKIIDGFQERDVIKVGNGFIELSTGETFRTILFKQILG